MTLAKYDSSLAYDQIMQRGLPGRVVEVTDPDTGIPVEGLLAMDGQPIARLVSNSQGYVQPFMVEDGPPLVRVRIETVAYHLLDLSLLGEASLAAQQAAQAAIDAANLVGAPADTAIATAVNAAGSATRAALDSRYAGKALATSAAAGLMAAADKAKLDAASANASNNSLVQRNASGDFSVKTPTAGGHPAPKSYVDGLDAVPKLGYKSKLATDAPNTYPTGYSTGLFAVSDGWPGPASFRNVATFVAPGYSASAVQWAYPYRSDPGQTTLIRYAKSSTEWGPWQEVADTASVSRTATELNRVSYSTEYVAATGTYPAHYVTKITGGTRAGNIVKKFTTDDSTAAAPPRSTLDTQYAARRPQILASASGYRTGGSWINQLVGLQIKDGVLIKGWDDDPTDERGREAVVFMRDGSMRIYDETTTPSAIIAEGGWNSFCWGSAAYKNGVATDFRKYTRYDVLSGRQLIADNPAGDLFIITVPGVSGTSGANGNHIVAIGARLGVKTLYILDGGGSAQTMLGGNYLVPSSDGTPREMPDFLGIYAPPVGSYLDTGWVPLILASGYKAQGTPVPAVRKKDGKTMLRGLVAPTSGSFPSSTVKVADFPDGFSPAYWQYRRTATSSMAVTAQVVARSGSGGIELNHSATGATWSSLDSVEWTD